MIWQLRADWTRCESRCRGAEDNPVDQRQEMELVTFTIPSSQVSSRGCALGWYSQFEVTEVTVLRKVPVHSE